MNKIQLGVDAIQTTPIILGFEGEQNHTEITFYWTVLFAQYPDAVATMVIKPPVGDPYPKTVTQDDNKVVWTVTGSDMAHPGSGEYQLTFTDGDEIIKTYVGAFSVMNSLTGSGEAPDPVSDWVTDANAKLAEVDSAIGEIDDAIEGIPDEVDDWLEDHITNPDSPPLDRTLSSSVSAAPADMVGGLKSAINNILSVGGELTNISKSNLGTGKYYDGNRTLQDNANSVYTASPIDVSAYSKISIVVSTVISTGSSRNFGFYNDGMSTGYVEKYTEASSGSLFESDGNGRYVFTIPVKGKYFVFSYTNVDSIGIYGYSPAKDEIDSIDEFIMLKDNTPVTSFELSLKNSNRVTTQEFAPIINRYKSVTISGINTSGYQYTLMYTLNGTSGNTGWGANNGTLVIESYSAAHIEFRKSDNSDMSSADIEAIQASITLNIEKQTIKDALRSVMYVSATGNDNGIGTIDNPLATVDRALEKGAEIINISSGIYQQTINLAKSTKGIVDIRNITKDGEVIFKPLNYVIATSETAESGYTKVYSASCDKTLDSNNIWLFQEDVADATTEIDNAERMPQQRGFAYRCRDTKIEKCTADNLSDALSEIEASTEYKWFLNSGTLYYSRPQTVDSSHPIAYASGTELFQNGSRSMTIKMTGIITKFVTINLDNTSESVLTDCSSMNCFGDGCITYDNADAVTLVRCEATRAFYGKTGDGINAHGVKTGTASAKKTTGHLIDCWSHDNRDDGFSDHECCESVLDGGLYEYNGKAGVTPSYGSHCVCRGVYSRKNYNGFFYTGEASDGGVYGQLECIGCIADTNMNGENQNHSGYQIDTTGNRMILIDCTSIGHRYGYYGASGSLVTLVNCKSANDTSVKTGSGTFTIINGSSVTA